MKLIPAQQLRTVSGGEKEFELTAIKSGSAGQKPNLRATTAEIMRRALAAYRKK